LPDWSAHPRTRAVTHQDRPSSNSTLIIEDAFRADQKSWQFFGQLAPSYRRDYIGWIDSAKRQTTKEKRLREALELLADEQKLPLR
ncbi:MAG TPA: hypothetical protein EYQ64_06325, partial [Gemmatimonadetes bacterium]|nr:hypothetical protein [Gemmatimonadota bacterium]